MCRMSHLLEGFLSTVLFFFIIFVYESIILFKKQKQCSKKLAVTINICHFEPKKGSCFTPSTGSGRLVVVDVTLVVVDFFCLLKKFLKS